MPCKSCQGRREKYSALFDDALARYGELELQALEMDADELMDARLGIRPERERSAADRLTAAYGQKYDHRLMHDSRRDVAALLNEEAGKQSIRERLRQHQKEQSQQRQQQKSKHRGQER